jgi:hypothetical protein
MRISGIVLLSAALMAIGAGGPARGDGGGFTEEVRAEPVAWHLAKMPGERKITLVVPRVIYCLAEPRLEAVVEEQKSRIVIKAYLLRGTGPEARCRKVKTRRKEIGLGHPIDGRPLYDGRFTPPRLRAVPVVPPADP